MQVNSFAALIRIFSLVPATVAIGKHFKPEHRLICVFQNQPKLCNEFLTGT